MPRKEKEEDRIERIIRGLLKEPENKRCINCNSLGPQYVCTTFWTFVCTNCSGVHREFSHRVKSVSMAKFKAEEISCLQTGGNERAREIYFKAWDPQRNVYPDASNLYRLREFIKHVYIDRKYAGQNSYEKPSTVKPEQRKDSYELQPVKTLSFSAKDDIMERHSSEKFSNIVKDDKEGHSFDKFSEMRGFRNIFEERRSPRVQESTRSRSRPTSRFEIVDDRFREDGTMKTYERYSSSKDSRSGSRSPGSQRSGKTSFPAIQPVKNILGEKGPVLKVGEPSKPSDGKNIEGPPKEQKAADSASGMPAKKRQNQENTVKFSSLIDFDANPEPSCTTAELQPQPKVLNTNTESSSAPLPAPGRENNALNLNSVESLLFELSGPATPPSVGPSQISNGAEASSGAVSALPNNLVATDMGSKNAPQVSSGNITLSNTFADKEQPLNSSNRDSMALVIQVNNSPASNDARQVQSVPLAELSQAGQSGNESKAVGRKELPADLFVSSILQFNPVAPSWQMPPPHAVGYGMQYHPHVMQMAGSVNRAKPSNPFDIADDGPQVHAPTLPSMTFVQGALPVLPAATNLQPQPSPYGTSFGSHVSPYGMNIPPFQGAYTGPQHNNMILTRPQGMSSFGNSQDAFASVNPIQQGTGTEYSSPSAPSSSFTQGRNPFG